MIEVQAVLLVVVAILGVGCGVSIGWVLHANYVKAHPAGIEAVSKLASQQMFALERSAADRIAKVEDTYSATIATLQNTIRELTFFAARPGAAAGPAPVAPSIPMQDAAARAVGENTSDRTALRDMLLSRGLDGPTADAVLDHRCDDIPPGTLLEQLADRLVAEGTRLQ